MAGRYDKRTVIRNSQGRYAEYFAKRRDRTVSSSTRGVIQWETPDIRYPTAEEMRNFTVVDHVWKQGDKFYKLADHYYGDPKLWWIIPWFNKKPFVADYKLGDFIHIPLPISEVFSFFD